MKNRIIPEYNTKMQGQRGVVEVLATLRQQLEKRGTKSIRNLGRTFRALDSFDGNNKIDRSEFAIGLKENGVEL